MPSKVWFANLRARGQKESKVAKIERLFEAAGLGGVITKGDLTALKLHFGEPGGDGFLRPMFARAVVDLVRKHGGKPFLTDTNTLYAGRRHNSVDHVEAALLNGFGFSAVAAPVIIADGLLGENVTEVATGTKHFAAVKIAGAVVRAEAMLVLSHVKAHEMAGFGGAIKNLAMGCAPGAGKRDQHSPRFDVNQDVCVGCGECASVCPTGAAAVEGGKASIDKEACIGCGECYIHCRDKAVQVDWRTEIPTFMERMTEYALGAVTGKRGKVGFLNFLVNITPDCDCVPWSDAAIVPDVGILASTDPVAIDQASFDLINAQPGLANTHLKCNHLAGEDKFRGVWSHTQPDMQMRYGAEIGLGDTAYVLLEI